MKHFFKTHVIHLVTAAGLFAIVTGVNVLPSESASVSLNNGEAFYFSSPSTGLVVFQGDSLVVASKSAAPSPAHKGQIYYDTTFDAFRGYNGSSWKQLATTSTTNTDN